MYPELPFDKAELDALIDDLFASSAWTSATTEAAKTSLIEALLFPYRDAQIAALVSPSQTVINQICDGFSWLVNQVKDFWTHKNLPPATRPNPPSADSFSDFVEHFWQETFAPVWGMLTWARVSLPSGGGGN